MVGGRTLRAGRVWRGSGGSGIGGAWRGRGRWREYVGGDAVSLKRVGVNVESGRPGNKIAASDVRSTAVSRGAVRTMGLGSRGSLGAAEPGVPNDHICSENNRRAKYYQLTCTGKAALRAQAARWTLYAEAVFTVLGTT
jgi:hypothetical protein